MLLNIALDMNFLDKIQNTQKTSKTRQTGWHQMKTRLHRKKDHQLSDDLTYRMGKIFQSTHLIHGTYQEGTSTSTERRN